MTSLRAREDEIFGRWKEASPHLFVSDGVPDEAAWMAAPRRVMILLKEPYGSTENSGGWDLRCGIVKYPISHYTWNNAARWAALAQSGGNVEWNDFAKPSQDQKRAILRSCAIVNVKKLAGGSRTSRAALLEAAEADSERLRAQFELYRPEITLLCGTAECLGPIFKDAQGERVMLSEGRPPITARRVPGLGMAIRVPHPQARGLNAQEFFCRLQAVFRDMSAGSGG